MLREICTQRGMEGGRRRSRRGWGGLRCPLAAAPLSDCSNSTRCVMGDSAFPLCPRAKQRPPCETASKEVYKDRPSGSCYKMLFCSGRRPEVVNQSIIAGSSSPLLPLRERSGPASGQRKWDRRSRRGDVSFHEPVR